MPTKSHISKTSGNIATNPILTSVMHFCSVVFSPPARCLVGLTPPLTNYWCNICTLIISRNKLFLPVMRKWRKSKIRWLNEMHRYRIELGFCWFLIHTREKYEVEFRLLQLGLPLVRLEWNTIMDPLLPNTWHLH